MSDELKNNVKQMKGIVKEIYFLSEKYDSVKNLEYESNNEITMKQKNYLKESIFCLTNQLRILNNVLPALIERIGFYKELSTKENLEKTGGNNLTKIKYKSEEGEQIELVIDRREKDKFLESLTRGISSMKNANVKYIENEKLEEHKKVGKYLKISNKLFKNLSNKLISAGYFNKLNKSLRKINSRYVIGSYISMMFLTTLILFVASIFLFIILLFFNVSLIYPFISYSEEALYIRLIKYFWTIPLIPMICLFLFYIIPLSEAKNLGRRIDQELPFVTIHMSAIASSGLEPVSIFRIILKGDDYKYTNIEFKKIMNLINFHGESTANALRKISMSTPSQKLKELLNGLAVTITSGGELSNFLNQHAETMLFDYKLEREKNNKVSETFMDIYISVAIAAPMILLMMFVIIGSTGLIGNFFNLSINAISLLLILFIVVLNIFFLLFLKIKQPAI